MVEPQQATWVKLAVLTVIVLAAAAGLSAFKASGYSTRAQIFAAREAQHWQDYQVVSLKKDNFGLHRDILASLGLPEAKTAKAPKTAAARIKTYEEEMGRLKEQDQIKGGPIWPPRRRVGTGRRTGAGRDSLPVGHHDLRGGGAQPQKNLVVDESRSGRLGPGLCGEKFSLLRPAEGQ
jgi:hypothetical protein